MTGKYLDESPYTPEKGPARDLARSIAEWVADAGRRSSDGAWVAGVHGDRGTGKTSLLKGVLEELEERGRRGEGGKPGEGDGRGLDSPVDWGPPRVVLPHPRPKSGFGAEKVQSPRRRDGREAGEPPQPGAATGRTTDRFLAPSMTRSGDGLLFVLLDHLHRFYARPGASPASGRSASWDGSRPEEFLADGGGADPYARARRAEARRHDLPLFLQYAREVAPSRDKLPEYFAEQYQEAATATANIQRRFAEILDEIRRPGKDAVVLFVDDLDLQPQRSLEMLELIHLFLHRPGVVVLLAADRDLLLHSLEEGLRERWPLAAHSQRGFAGTPGLAAELMAKLIPLWWTVPTPTPAERVAFAWSGRGGEEGGALRVAWKKEPLEGLLSMANVARHSRELRQERWREGSRPEGPAPGGKEDPVQREILERLLPDTWRGLVAYRNRLQSVVDRAMASHGRTSGAGEGDAFAAVAADLSRRWAALGLDADGLPSWAALLLAVDVRWPELQVWSVADRDPRALREFLIGLGEIVDKGEVLGAGAGPQGPGTIPLLDRVGPPFLDGMRLHYARVALAWLGKQWSQVWSPGSIGAFARLRWLVVSLNQDALGLTRARRSGVGGPAEEAEMEAWHVDLQAHALLPGPRADAVGLRAARADARRLIEERGVRSFDGALQVFAKAQIPLAAWLGWYLRHVGLAAVYNEWQGVWTPFLIPPEVGLVRAPGTGVFHRLRIHEPEDVPEGPGDQAVVIVDLSGKATPAQLREFWTRGPGGEEQVRAGHRYLLQVPEGTGSRVEADDAVPILEDVMELLRVLRDSEGVRAFHLGFAGPTALAFLLGRHLNAQGVVHLYELLKKGEQTRYEYVFDLDGEDGGGEGGAEGER